MTSWIKRFDKGKKRKQNPSYTKLIRQRKSMDGDTRINALKEMRKTHCTNTMVPDFKRLLLLRTMPAAQRARGSKDEAIMIKNQIKSVLTDKCG